MTLSIEETPFLDLIPLKAIGGSGVVFCMLGSYESAAPYKIRAFYRLLIAHCGIKVRSRPPKRAIPLYIQPYLKNNA